MILKPIILVVGASAGMKKAGVSQADQAAFLTKGFHRLAGT